jgi:amphi-Trp domain-containing protein
MGHKKSGKDALEYTAVVPAEQAAEYFEKLAAGLREHLMVVESGNSSVALDVAREIKLELEINADPRKSSIEFALSWRPDEAEIVAKPSLTVVTRDGADALDIGDGMFRGLRSANGKRDDVPTDRARRDRIAGATADRLDEGIVTGLAARDRTGGVELTDRDRVEPGKPTRTRAKQSRARSKTAGARTTTKAKAPATRRAPTTAKPRGRARSAAAKSAATASRA